MVYADDFDDRAACRAKPCNYVVKEIDGDWYLSEVEDKNRVKSKCKFCGRNRTDFWGKGKKISIGDTFTG